MKRNRIVLWFSVVVFCSLLLSTLMALLTIHRISRAHNEAFMQTLSYEVERSIREPLNETLVVSRTVANDSLLIELLGRENGENAEQAAEQITAYTERLRESFGYSWAFVVPDASLNYYTNEGLYRTLDPAHEPDDAWYAAFVQSGEEYTVMIGQDNENSDAWTLFTDMRIEDEDGTFLGVCGMALELPDLQQRLREYEEQYDMRVCFVDRDGVEQLQSGSMEDATDTITLPQEALEQKFVVTQTDWHGTCTVIRHLEELDWYMVIEDLNPYDYTNDYMLVSINAAIFALFLVLTVLALYYILKQERILTIHSYHDRLTGLLNRRAFEEDVQRLRDGAVPDSVWVVAFDVNGLKQVNDTDGHAAGDELVMAAAQLIFCSFGAFGRCYRMGGDEFLALMDRQPEDVEAMLRHFEAQVADWHGTQVEAIDIAYGTAHAADHPGSSIDELVFLADEAMYRKKREHYSREQQTQNRP